MATHVHESRSPRQDETKRIRLTVDISPEMRRRIKMAAAQRDLTVRDYVVRILEEAVPGTAEPTQAQQGITPEAVERLFRTRDETMRGRYFTDDSTDLLREARDERTEEL
jgi:uncharacterized protein (DUF1778 family)